MHEGTDSLSLCKCVRKKVCVGGGRDEQLTFSVLKVHLLPPFFSLGSSASDELGCSTNKISKTNYKL